jgi:N-acylneuraminate cytidylyltransferase/CMP-N,N'-diacetyllegionaminic acid synthase
MIAIIPARSGSKGLPGKNIKLLNGKPMIAYTIEAAKKAKLISDVIVSTDSQEIADIAIKYGAINPFLRPASLATDNAKAIDNYLYTVERLNEEFGYNVNAFTVLQPTSPLRTADDIDEAITLFTKKNADSVISYTKEHHPITWHKYLDEDQHFENIFDETLDNRQDRRISYFPNGAIYIFSHQLIKSHRYYSEKSFAYVMPQNRSIDVDYIDDFEYVEYLIEKNNAQK